MTPPRLTVLGSLNVDLVAHVSRAPDRGETVGDGVLHRQLGGKGANQAMAAHRLGAVVSMLGAVGRDPGGDALLAALGDEGLDLAGVQRVSEPTGTALITVDRFGENSIVVCPGANGALDPQRMAIDPEAALLAQLEIDVSVVEIAATQTNGMVVLNASPTAPMPPALWDRVDLFIVNETEFATQPELAAAPLVAVTLGARGAVLLKRGSEVARASHTATTVVSTVGAGDAFAAALTVGLLCGNAPDVALTQACAVGADAVASPLSQPPLRPLASYGAPSP